LGLSECPDSEPDRAGAEGAIQWFVRQSA